jgi:hypothetical protein
MSPRKTVSADKARAAWGDPLPDWIAVLAAECDRTSQGAVGARLRRPGGQSYSAATVNCVLGKTYGADLAVIEEAVRSALMAATVDCPVVGEMPISACRNHQRAGWSPRNAMIRDACPTCPHAKTGGSKDAE